MSDPLAIWIGAVGIVVGVLFGGGGLVSYLKYRGDKRQRERQAIEEAQSRRAAERREIGAAVLASTRQLRNEFDTLRHLHDSLVTRFFFDPFSRPAAARRIRIALNAIIECRSKLILDPDAGEIEQAVYDFIDARDAYGTALMAALGTWTKKADPQKLAALEATMNAKLGALEAAVRRYVNDTPLSAPSQKKHFISKSLAWMRHPHR